MKNDDKNKFTNTASAVWDYVFSDDPSIRETLNDIVDGKPLHTTLVDIHSQREEVSRALFDALSSKVDALAKKTQDNPSMKPEEAKLVQLQVYHLLCFLTYTEPTADTIINIPTLAQDPEQGSHWVTIPYSIQPKPLCGKSDDPYQAYYLTPDASHPDASALLLFPGTAPLPWNKGAFLTYASDITPYRNVGGSIYAQSKEQLRELVNVSRHPVIAVGHSLGGAMCGMLARDNPNVSIRAFSAPFALSTATRLTALATHILIIALAATLLYFGAPVITTLAACALVAVATPLVCSLCTYVWRNFLQRQTAVAASPSPSGDGLPHHLLATQKQDIVSLVGDQTYTDQCINIELRHDGKQKNLIRAHTQAFSHLPNAHLVDQVIQEKTSSFRRIIANAYWEALVKPFASIGLYISFVVGYHWPRNSLFASTSPTSTPISSKGPKPLALSHSSHDPVSSQHTLRETRENPDSARSQSAPTRGRATKKDTRKTLSAPASTTRAKPPSQ